MDLSTQHEPLSGLFPIPQSPAQWQDYALDREQVCSFQENGFLAGIPILDTLQLRQLREELDKVIDPSHPGNSLFYEFHLNESEEEGKVLFHALGAWQLEPALHDLPWSPALRLAAYQLLGGAVRLFHDQLFIKPPEHGGVVAWHQDYSYWTWTEPMGHLSCWIPLDDAGADNGCLQYIPGSHHWGLLPRTGLTGEMEAAREVLNESQREALESPVLAELPAGQGVFHHPLTLHGSGENRSEKPRRAIVINMALDGVRSNAAALEGKDTHNFPILPQGRALSGPYHPLLFSPERELGSKKNSLPLVDDPMEPSPEDE